ncbi:hypothetical protein H671_1g1590 [Cricetulus griseus]|uniref:Uncharacterized protein n=1 Tax=Cricetulus griseus TaxID=10029 RepID=A0A061ILL5_CRIGR|nr:hypothetical protein H671_1g1590 [Cricetulus griseus]
MVVHKSLENISMSPPREELSQQEDMEHAIVVNYSMELLPADNARITEAVCMRGSACGNGARKKGVQVHMVLGIELMHDEGGIFQCCLIKQMTCRHCQHNPAKVIDHQRIELFFSPRKRLLVEILFTGVSCFNILITQIFSRNPGQQEDILDFSFSINTDIMIITR